MEGRRYGGGMPDFDVEGEMRLTGGHPPKIFLRKEE